MERWEKTWEIIYKTIKSLSLSLCMCACMLLHNMWTMFISKISSIIYPTYIYCMPTTWQAPFQALWMWGNNRSIIPQIYIWLPLSLSSGFYSTAPFQWGLPWPLCLKWQVLPLPSPRLPISLPCFIFLPNTFYFLNTIYFIFLSQLSFPYKNLGSLRARVCVYFVTVVSTMLE